MTTPPALTVSRENIKVRKLFEVPSYIQCFYLNDLKVVLKTTTKLLQYTLVMYFIVLGNGKKDMDRYSYISPPEGIPNLT
jgi:hypothetical protein